MKERCPHKDETKYKRYAFISYSHKDAKEAKWLHKRLEYYKLPSDIYNEYDEKNRYLRPIFRDKEDIGTGILKSELRKELEVSEYLIVICSPNSAQSTYVSQEAQVFIELGRINHIIPYNNWVLEAQESYNRRSNSLYYMEKGIPYALKLITKFDIEKYKNIVSDFYSSLANVASHDDDSDKSLKVLQYANKSLELNANNIEAYETLATYFYYNGGIEKNKKIKEIITKVEKIAPNYKNSKDNILYQLLDNESIKLINRH